MAEEKSENYGSGFEKLFKVSEGTSYSLEAANLPDKQASGVGSGIDEDTKYMNRWLGHLYKMLVIVLPIAATIALAILTVFLFNVIGKIERLDESLENVKEEVNNNSGKSDDRVESLQKQLNDLQRQVDQKE